MKRVDVEMPLPDNINIVDDAEKYIDKIFKRNDVSPDVILDNYDIQFAHHSIVFSSTVESDNPDEWVKGHFKNYTHIKVTSYLPETSSEPLQQ